MSDAPVAMISGANRGIGASIADTLLAAGWRVSLGCRTPPSERPTRDDWLSCHYDALDAASGQAWVDETLRTFGRLDALINNAGILSQSTVLEASGDEFDRVMAVNARAPMHHRAGTLSALFLVAYLMQGGVAMLLGRAATAWGLDLAIDVGSVALAALSLGALLLAIYVRQPEGPLEDDAAPGA